MLWLEFCRVYPRIYSKPCDDEILIVVALGYPIYASVAGAGAFGNT